MADAYNSISEYFLDLVQQDQKRKAQEKLEALLLEELSLRVLTFVCLQKTLEKFIQRTQRDRSIH